MQTRNLIFGLFLVTCIISLSCSTSSKSDLQLPVMAESPMESPAEIALLPGYGYLPAPTHEVSMEGPGWYDIQVGTFLVGDGVSSPHPIDELPLSATVNAAYAMYGVYGFDGDNGPTSARVTATDISDEYYVGFSDYIAGKWAFSGPFTGTATVEIPNENNYISPSAFTSENGHCYMAVVVPSGGSMILTKVELGIHGGILGPQPPEIMGRHSSPSGIQMSWVHSVDVDKPDFAGYVVERAPQLHGDFKPLTAFPITATSYIDYTAHDDTAYRYRVNAEDMSGNCGLGHSLNIFIDPAGELSPIPLVKLPPGPLHGPLDVVFDMTGSTDPEGQPIDDYTIAFWGEYISTSGPGPIKTISMQPGCYIYNAYVTCGTRTSSTRGYLKIYPAWHETPSVVKSSVPNYTRGVWLTSGIHPATGRLIHVTNDQFSDQFLLLAEDETGALNYESVHMSDSAACVQQPVAFNDQLLFLVQSNSFLQIVAHDGVTAEAVHGTGNREQSVAGLATDGTERVWMVVCIADGADYHLNVIDTGVHTNIHNIVENTGLLSWIEAEYNPALDALDIVYTINGSNAMYWVRDNLDGVPGLPVEINPGMACAAPTMTVNPANNRPMVAYLNSANNRVQFTALTSDLATWTAPEIIDDSTNNVAIHGMVLDGDYPMALIALDDGSLNVYRRGATWNKTNTLPDSDVLFVFCSLTQTPGAPGCTVTYRDTNTEIQSYNTKPDGTNIHRWTIPGFEPTGIELHGAGGSDGLHVVFRQSDGSGGHFISADGSAWTGAPGVATAQNINLVAADNGDVYLSYYDANFAHLNWWNGAGWTSVSSIATDILHLPILNSDASSNRVRFACYDPALSQMLFHECEHGVLPLINAVPCPDNIWAGLVSNIGNKTVMILGGTQPTGGVVNRGAWSAVEASPLYYGGTSLIMMDGFYIEGKTMAHAHFHTKYMFGDGDAFWLVNGPRGDPARVTQSGLELASVDYLELGDSDTYQEPRRTVTAITTPAWTAVALLSNMTGVHTRFEWSSFGDWETLPLPRGIEHMMNPELVCGEDGRWHIIYRDWVTDDLMCISTL